ncbi:MAG TPA: C39 family peptidase, partial [Candidatus Udaeobacter sp.]|nr:C39 family peptidase [Candidatus Udaeobacter sp.]
MIAVERTPLPGLDLARPSAASSTARRRPLLTRVGAVFLVLTVVSSLGGWGLVDFGSAYVLQARANALHDRWAVMRAQGIPDSDLAELEQEWTVSHQTSAGGVAALFWLPGGADAIARWQAESDSIWSRDLSRYRADAQVAEQTLHRALGNEPFAQRKARLEALTDSTTPLDFATLRADWETAARLVPIDARIASIVTSVVGQTAQAKQLGIRDDPAATVLAGAAAYSGLGSQQRLARAEFLTRRLGSLEKDLKGRIGAATVTAQALQHAKDEASLAELYGIDATGYRATINADSTRYASALTVAEFNSLTGDLGQVAASAGAAINVTLSQTHLISGVTFYYQDHPLSCEEASTSMAMTHQGVYVSQDQILAEIGADRRPMYVDSSGRVRWGNPYETFVGNVNGSESNYTGFGTYYPPLVRMAQAHGARVLAYGSMSAATIYARVIAGHPVVAFATWDWQWHPRRDYLSFDGQWIPWIGPVYASHVYVVVGVSPTQVLINDPIRGQYWVSKGAFEAG